MSVSTTAAVPLPRASWLDRLMRLAADVRAGEAVTALLLSLNVFLLLAAYYIIRPVREGLILPGGGAEIRSYAGAVLAVLFIFIVPAYGAFASKVNRIRLINWVTLFFVSNLILFRVLGNRGIPVGVPFYLWASIFNLMVIAQFWSFANDLYTEEQGKRLFAIVGFGQSVGAVAGSTIAAKLIGPLGLLGLLIVAAGLLVGCLALTNVIHLREKDRAPGSGERRPAGQPLGSDGGFQLVLRHRYLLLIGLMTLMIQFVNTNGEYILARTISNAAAAQVQADSSLSEGQIIGGFYANFHFYQNLLSALIQFFLVSRIFKYLGVTQALFIMPLISLSGYGLMATVPVLAYIRAAKILENSTDYSLQNTVRRALFLPTSREAKYKALQAVETFFWRGGDALSGGATFVVVQLIGMGVAGFASVNIALVAIWLLLAGGIHREYGRLKLA